MLLVDDNADSREMYGLFLTGRGFAVNEAEDGDEALIKVRDLIPSVVVTDVRLPSHLDGFALCREIRRDRRTEHVPVIAVTGYCTPTYLDEAERAGFDAFLVKPCDPGELLAQIRRTIQTTRDARARSHELRAQSRRLCRETSEVVGRSADLLKRLFDERAAKDR